MSEVRGVYDERVGRPDAGLDLVVVGVASRDITPDDPRGWRLGGAASYCSLAAARLGLRVGALIGVDGPAAEATELGLLDAAGVVVCRVPLEHGPVFENIERDGHRRQRWLSASDEVPVEALPDEWSGARGWLFGLVAGEVGADWAAVPPAGARVAVAWQGLLRRFAADGWVERVDPTASPLLGTAGLVCSSIDDFGPGVRIADLRVFAPGAAIVMTEGDRGGTAMHGSRLVRYPAIPTPRVVDPTGAGDVFLAALMAEWLRSGELATPRGLRFAAAAGSCAVEDAGLAGVPTQAQATQRLRSIARLDPV